MSGIGVRDILLILRARDDASRVLGGLSRSMQDTAKKGDALKAVGGAMASIGTALVVAGASGVAAMQDMTQSFMEYDDSARMALTQTTGFGQKLEDLKRIGEEVALAVPAKFKEMQSTIYDIFSTFDFTDTMKTKGAQGVTDMAKVILESMSKAAVAAQVSTSIVNEAVLSTMNAYGFGAEKATYTTDILMQMVAKGKGTFAEFGSQISKVIPTAVSAGQSMEEVGAAMAFMTSRGFTVPIAATSVRRALGAMTDPKAIARLKQFGVNVLDTTGKIRPMSDVMSELSDKFKGMSNAQKIKVLDELFKGAGGTEAAMQFLNLAINDTNKDLKQFQGFMFDAAGATEQAYEIMKDSPAAQMQALSNSVEVFKEQLGGALWQVVKPFVGELQKLVLWFTNLDEGTKKNIATFLLVGTVIAILVGAFLIIGGAILMIAGSIAAIGGIVAALPIIGIMAGVVVAVAAVIAIGVLLWQNWDKVKEVATNTWNTVRSALTTAGSAIWSTLKNIGEALRPLGHFFMDTGRQIIDAWNQLYPLVFPPFMNAIRSLAANFMAFVTSPGVKSIIGFLGQVIMYVGMAVGAIAAIIAAIIGFVGLSTIAGILKGLAGGIVAIINGIVAVVTGIINIVSGVFAILAGIFSLNGDLILEGVLRIFTGLIGVIVGLLGGLVVAVWNILVGFVTGFIGFWAALYDTLVGHSIVPDMVNAIIMWIASLPGAIFGLLGDLVNGAIAWFVSLAVSAGIAVIGLVASVLDKFGLLNTGVGQFIMTMVTNGVAMFIGFVVSAGSSASNLVNTVVSFFGGMPGRVWDAISGIGSRLVAAGNEWLSGLGNAVNGGILTTLSYFFSLPGRILSALDGFSLSSVGYNIVNSLANAISGAGSRVADALRGVVNSAINAAKRALGIASPSKVAVALGNFTGEGLAIGLDKMQSMVSRSGKALALAAIPNMNDMTFRSPYTQTPQLVRDYNDSVNANNGAGQGTTVNNFDIDVNTQEIDPVKHSADLGYEISRTLGKF